MKRTSAWILAACLASAAFGVAARDFAAEALRLGSAQAIVVDEATGEVLF